jgi:hypothetical protein
MLALHKMSANLREMPTSPNAKIFCRLLGIKAFSFAGIECGMSLRAILKNSYRFFVP